MSRTLRCEILFTLDRDRCFHIAEAIRVRGLKFSFECETRMDDLDERLIRVLHAAGLREISFGVEVTRSVLKRVGRRIDHEHMRTMVKLCWDLGLKTTAFYVIGFLQDTEESIEELIRFACDLDTTYVNFKILTPYPGTPQFKQLKHLVFETDWEKFDGYTLTFDHPTLTPRQLDSCSGWHTLALLRPSQLFNLLGLPRYSHHALLQRADAWSWEKQDYLDRPWISERKVTA
jgi:anaerobic magnesium-protoporphyrin IX monomethyl ester cyclase